MTGVAAHAFLEPYIGVSDAKVTNNSHPATLPTLPRSISSTPTLHPIRSHASSHPLPRSISPDNTYLLIYFYALFSTTCASPPPLPRILSRPPRQSLPHTHILPPPLTGRCSITYTYSSPQIHEHLHRITRTYLPIATHSSRTPTYPLSPTPAVPPAHPHTPTPSYR